MAWYDTTVYCNAGDQSTTGYYAIAKRPQNAAVVAGAICRQFTTPAVNSERAFICIVAGTTANVTDATWVLPRGSKTTDGTVTWMECTGITAVNGDLTNTLTWTAAKALSGTLGSPSLGVIIKRNNGASYQICTTAGAMGASEPAFSDTAGVTTTDSSAVWTSLGPVGNFTGGMTPHARLTIACTANWFVNDGSTVYVGDNHAETNTSNIIITPGTGLTTLTGKILCHNHLGSYPPAASDLTTGATISTVSTSATAITFQGVGTFYIYGLTFKAGVGATSGVSGFTLTPSSTPGGWYYFDRCSFQIPVGAGSGSGSIILGGGSATCVIIWNNTTLKYGSTNSLISLQLANFTWQNTGQVLESGSSIPTTLMRGHPVAYSTFIATLEALDLSQLASTTLFGASGNGGIGPILIKDCKLNASTIPASLSFTGPAVQLVRCDSAGTYYKSARYTYEGTETTETAITRVGGSVDPAGQAQSRKIVTSANGHWLRPFKAEPYGIWNARTAANVVVTVYGTINAGALPNNDDIWLEIEYLGSSATPLGTTVNTTKASVLAANAAVAADGSTWNGGGSGAGWSPFKLTTTLSSPQPGLPGYIHVRVRAAKASTTFYIDPQAVLT